MGNSSFFMIEFEKEKWIKKVENQIKRKSKNEI